MPASVNGKVQTDKSSGKKFITFKTASNGAVKYVKVGLWTRDDRQAQRWADCLDGIVDPQDARAIIDYLRSSPSQDVERQRIAEITTKTPLISSVSLDDARSELCGFIAEFGELPEPTDDDIRAWQAASSFNAQRDILVRLGVPAEWLADCPDIFQDFKPRTQQLNPNFRPRWKAIRALGLPATPYKAARGPKLSDCLREWRTEQELKGTGRNHRNYYRNRFLDFMAFIGGQQKDKPVKALAKKDFVAFRDHKRTELKGKTNKTINDHLDPIAAILTTARKRMEDGTFPEALDHWLAVFETLPYKPKASNKEPVPPEVFKEWLAKADDFAEMDWRAYGDSLPIKESAPAHSHKMLHMDNRKNAKRMQRNAHLAHLGFCLAANCGTTGIDLVRLRWSELRLTGKLPLFMQPRTKSEKNEDMIIPVKCPLLPETVRSLKRWRAFQQAERESDFVFTSELCTPFDDEDSSAVSEIFKRIRDEVEETNGWEARHCRNIGATVQRDKRLPDDMATAWLRHSESGTNPFYRGVAKEGYLKPLIQAIGKLYF